MAVKGVRYHNVEYGLIEELAALNPDVVPLYLLGRELCAAAGPDGNDGEMSGRDVRVLGARLGYSTRRLNGLAGDLDGLGFWERTEEGYHDLRFLLANRSAEQRQEAKQGDADRHRKSRALRVLNETESERVSGDESH